MRTFAALLCCSITAAAALAATALAADAPATQPDSANPTVVPSADASAAPADGNDNSGRAAAPDSGGRPRRSQRFMEGFRGLRNGPGGLGAGGFGGPGGFGFGGPMLDLSNEPALTDDEWQKISDFSQDNFPNRWKLYQRVRDLRGEDAPIVKGIKMRFAMRYRSLMKSQSDDSVYQAALSLGKLEDNAWGLSQRMSAEPNNVQLRQQLHDAVADLVKSQLAERGRRLQTARDALAFEQARFESDTQNIDRLIDGRTERLANAAGDINQSLVTPTTLPAK